MLYIIFDNGVSTNELAWHVGQKIQLMTPAIQAIVEVQADGDELKHIMGCMDNVPNNRFKPTNRWFGDMAKFIAVNL
jgi:hypothetical protein